MLLLIFIVLFSLSFAVTALVLRSSKERRLLNKRLGKLLVGGVSEPGVIGLQSLLRQRSKQRGALTRWAGQLRPIRALARLVYQSTGKRSVTPVAMLSCVLAVTAFGGVLLTTGMLPVAVVLGILLGSAPIMRLSYLRQRRVNAFNKVLPDCIDLCARALRAGHSLVAAIGIVADQVPEPAKREFDEIFKKQNYGLPLRDALLETLERLPSADFRVFVTGILVQRDTGGNLTEIFDRIVLVMRERLRIEGEIRVHTAQGRLTAWILTLLPPVMFIVVNALNPGYSKPMFADSTGRTFFYAGLVSLVVGGVLVRRIVNGIEV